MTSHDHKPWDARLMERLSRNSGSSDLARKSMTRPEQIANAAFWVAYLAILISGEHHWWMWALLGVWLVVGLGPLRRLRSRMNR